MNIPAQAAAQSQPVLDGADTPSPAPLPGVHVRHALATPCNHDPTPCVPPADCARPYGGSGLPISVVGKCFSSTISSNLAFHRGVFYNLQRFKLCRDGERHHCHPLACAPQKAAPDAGTLSALCVCAQAASLEPISFLSLAREASALCAGRQQIRASSGGRGE